METGRLIAWWYAQTSSGDPLIDWLSRAGPLGILAVIVVAFVRGWIVPKPEVDRLLHEIEQQRSEKERALDLVFKTAEVSNRAVLALREAKEKWPDLHE